MLYSLSGIGIVLFCLLFMNFIIYSECAYDWRESTIITTMVSLVVAMVSLKDCSLDPRLQGGGDYLVALGLLWLTVIVPRVFQWITRR